VILDALQRHVRQRELDEPPGAPAWSGEAELAWRRETGDRRHGQEEEENTREGEEEDEKEKTRQEAPCKCTTNAAQMQMAFGALGVSAERHDEISSNDNDHTKVEDVDDGDRSVSVGCRSEADDGVAGPEDDVAGRSEGDRAATRHRHAGDAT
jgi:hypothetical protein